MFSVFSNTLCWGFFTLEHLLVHYFLVGLIPWASCSLSVFLFFHLICILRGLSQTWWKNLPIQSYWQKWTPRPGRDGQLLSESSPTSFGHWQDLTDWNVVYWFTGPSNGSLGGWSHDQLPKRVINENCSPILLFKSYSKVLPLLRYEVKDFSPW